ncbi:MAG: hypothetical protein AAB724_02390 [Patescibacteria group bacterium]
MEFLKKLWQCFFCWRVAPEESRLKLCGTDVVIAQSFGGRKDGPGLSNEALAKIAFYASMVSDPVRLPVILQWEIVGCFPGGEMVGVIHRHRQTGKYLDAREMLAQAWEICQKSKDVWFRPEKQVDLFWKKAIIVAHPDHMWRVMKAAEKIGFEVMAADTTGVPYDKESVQWWTRSRFRFRAREIPARIYYLLRGWI